MLNELAKEVYEIAKEHGWHEQERPFSEVIALCHSELSEALEEYRNDREMLYYNHVWENYEFHKKPEGIAVEMIDCIIRILDWCGENGIDVDHLIREKIEFNRTRPYRHGNKKC